MVAIGIIVSAVAMVLFAKISFLAGFALTLGAYTLVNHSDLKDFARAQKELEDKLVGFNTLSLELNNALENLKQESQTVKSEKEEIFRYSSELQSQLSQGQEYFTNINASIDSLIATSSILDARLNDQQVQFKTVDENIKQTEEKTATLERSVDLFRDNVRSFQDSVHVLGKELLDLGSLKDQIQELTIKTHNLQDDNRGNIESLNQTIIEITARLEVVSSNLEKTLPLFSQIQRMDQQLRECWEISQRLNQQQGPRMAPAQQFQQVVRSAQGLGYRR